MAKIHIVAAVCIALFVTVPAGCGSTSTSSTAPSVPPQGNGTAAGFPVNITNCGQSLRFDNPPTRVASLDRITTEIMLQLGLGGTIVGASYNGTPFKGGAGFPSTADAQAKVPVLSEKYPSLEVLLNASPDFVTGNTDSYTFGSVTDGGTGFTRDEMAAKGIKTYTFLCKGEKATNDLVLSRYEELGKIFGKQQEAQDFTHQIRASLTGTAKVVEGATPVTTFFYQNGHGPLRTVGGGGQFDNGLKLAGGKGIFDDQPSFPDPTVSAEQVIQRNPDAIVIVSRGDLDETDPSVEQKREFLVETLGPGVNAVKNNRFCTIDFNDFITHPRTAVTLTTLAPCLHPELPFN